MIKRIRRRAGIEFSKILSKTGEYMQFFGDLDYSKYRLQVFNLVRFYSCYKEPETVEWIESFGREDIVYDVGAAVGAYSLIMSKYAKEVYSFEPALTNFNLLSKNILHNIRQGLIINNIVPINIALSSNTSLCDFNYGSLEEGAASHSLGNTDRSTFGKFVPVLQIKTISLSIDDAIRLLKFPTPNHIKIDVDGNEKEIIDGMKETLKNPNLKSILIEVTYANDGETLIETIKSYGFKLVKKSDRDKRYANHIFIREKV